MKDVFLGATVLEEARHALKLKKRIILVHHPDTNTETYVNFDHYINTAPEDLKILFKLAMSIRLERPSLAETVVDKVARILEGDAYIFVDEGVVEQNRQKSLPPLSEELKSWKLPKKIKSAEGLVVLEGEKYFVVASDLKSKLKKNDIYLLRSRK